MALLSGQAKIIQLNKQEKYNKEINNIYNNELAIMREYCTN